MTTALYRINGGEVVKISATDQQFAERDADYWAVAADPNFPDGTDLRPDGGAGPLRTLGYAKIIDGGDCRNATQPEIDNFAVAQDADESLMDRNRARELLTDHPQWRKLMTAFADIIMDEINILRGWTIDFKAEVAAATSLANLQTRVATLPDLSDRTLAQLKTALTNRISEND